MFFFVSVPRMHHVITCDIVCLTTYNIILILFTLETEERIYKVNWGLFHGAQAKLHLKP